MNSIKDIYRIGYGPSSSHTIGPMRAAKYFKQENPEANRYEVTLYGSLSLTGKGHRTDDIIRIVLGEDCTNIIFDKGLEDNRNRMLFRGFVDDQLLVEWNAESLGGGAIHIDEFETDDSKEFYSEKNFAEIKEYLEIHGITLLDYILEHEPTIIEDLEEPLDAMLKSVENGLNSEGLINARLKVSRTAKQLYKEAVTTNNDKLKKMAYAYAAAEENAMGHIVVTAPTLGSCGIVASLMYYALNDLHLDKHKLCEALAVGGLFGNIVKQNASIAGAIGGCQAEVGTACSMAAAMISYLNDCDLNVIEYAAEIGIEHHLGLTCDPVMGYVIIPCIERNAMAILRSFDAYELSNSVLRFKSHLVTFDMVVSSMNYTGKHLVTELKETSLGGLALEFKDQ